MAVLVGWVSCQITRPTVALFRCVWGRSRRVARDLHTIAPGPLAYVLETVRGAVRRLSKISNCAFQGDYYYYYFDYSDLSLNVQVCSLANSQAHSSFKKCCCSKYVCGCEITRRSVEQWRC